MSIGIFILRGGLWMSVGLCSLASAGCSASHVQLLFPPQNDSGEYWVCPPADPAARPEHRKNECKPAAGGFDPKIGNSNGTTRVDVRTCDVGEYRSITIMDADSSEPKVYVTCGQPMGDAPQSTQAEPLDGGLPMPSAASPGSDLNGGLPPPDATLPGPELPATDP